MVQLLKMLAGQLFRFNFSQAFTDEEFEEIFAHYDQASLCTWNSLFDKIDKKDR